MKRLLLGTKDYENHTTSESWQMQLGLIGAGWTPAGYGYSDTNDVRKLLDIHKPDVVMVMDARDWHADSPGTFRRESHFTNASELENCGAYVVTIAKEPAGVAKWQGEFWDAIGARALVHYYHERSIAPLLPLGNRTLIRTYHSVDKNEVPFETWNMRKRGIVTGARNPSVYPLREQAFRDASVLGLETLAHPGYTNKRNCTPYYLLNLSRYKVHVATSSKYGFLLRKIIESICCGCAVVTDLPEYDEVPYGEQRIVRVKDGSPKSLADAVEIASGMGSLYDVANKSATHFYDYRYAYERLSNDIMRAARNA